MTTDGSGEQYLAGSFEAGARERSPGVAVVVIDRGSVIRAWDAGAEALFGYSTAEAVGADLAELLVPPTLRHDHRQGVAAWARGEGGTLLGGTYSVPTLHRDGTVQHREITLVPIDVAGESLVAGLFVEGRVVVADTPPRGLLEYIFDQAPEIITLIGEDGRQRHVNTSGSIGTDYGVVGRLPIRGSALIHPDDRAPVAQRFSGLFDGQPISTEPFRYRVLSGAGEWLWLETVVSDLRHQPEVGGIVAFSRDVTVDEERRALLDETRARLMAAIEAMPGAAAIEDSEGRIAHANSQLAAWMGTGSDELLGTDVSSLLEVLSSQAMDGATVAAQLEAARRQPGSASVDGIRLRDERVVVLETVPIVLSAGDERPGRLWLGRDVTTRAVMEDELRRSLARELEARRTAEQAKDELQNLADARLTFVSSVSHELRTPLTSIASAVDFLASDDPAVTGTDSDTVQQYLQLIQRNTARLVSLVDELLMIGRLSAGHMQPARGAFDMVSVVREAVDSLKPAARARGMEIELTASDGPQAVAESDHIHQIVVNLVENAIKYGDDGSTVRIGCSWSTDGWQIVVEDRGTGIDEDDRKRIFEPFFRSARSRSTRGSGLGLAIVRGLIELHGGSVAVDPGFVGGARFVCRLPG